tara:strand:- start:679 stop:1038 length:360 start_codon:yes stop_codon:yes gene_type:complete
MIIYSLESIPYYNSIEQEYTNILVINKPAEGPLKEITKRIRLNKLSPFEAKTNLCSKPNCMMAIVDIENKNELMCVDNLPNLFEFLINNGYTIDNSVTKVLQKSKVTMNKNLICLIQYV